MSPFSLLSMTTLESQMIGQPRSEFKFVRSSLDRFFAAISLFLAGILFLSLIGLPWFIELPFFLIIAVSAVALALGIWGTIILAFPYEIRFNAIDRTIERRFRILFFWSRTTVARDKVLGLEVRTYLARNSSVKDWEFWLVLDSSKKGASMKFIARTKHKVKAEKGARALTKR
ncbi:MAG: hypothetical protein ACXAB4_04540, partial [Candidatus Hodarchaeales archaeon]